MEVFHHVHNDPSNVTQNPKIHDIPSHAERSESVEDEPAVKKRRSETESAVKHNEQPSKLREWSAQVEKALKHNEEQTYTTYQLVAFYGDPEKPIPGYIKYARKEVVREMLLDIGFLPNECTGTKKQLLEKLQKDKPYVVFKIDGREGFQRILATALHTWKYDLSHLYNVKMPLRGIDPEGARTFKEIFRDFYENGMTDVDPTFRKFIMMDIANSQFPDYSRDEKTDLVERILNGKVDGDTHRPTRILRGTAFEMPGEFTQQSKESESFRDNDLSIERAALHVGDRIKYIYDFGDPHAIVVYVQKVLHDHPVVPEISAGYLPVRAEILTVSAHKPPKQHGNQEETREEEEEDEGKVETTEEKKV